MAVLCREDFLAKVKALTGDDTSDEILDTIKDITDTYDELYKTDTEDWHQKYDDLDKKWREKYKEAFFSPKEKGEKFHSPKDDEEDEEDEPISIKDLFKPVGGK